MGWFVYRRHLSHSRVKNLFKFVSAKMDTVFTVESALEFDACFHLEYSHDITSYEAQLEGFIYEFNGRPCPYTPDFKINHSVNGFQFLEIKPVEKQMILILLNVSKPKELKLQKMGYL